MYESQNICEYEVREGMRTANADTLAVAAAFHYIKLDLGYSRSGILDAKSFNRSTYEDYQSLEKMS